jgi:hypothetical protein
MTDEDNEMEETTEDTALSQLLKETPTEDLGRVVSGVLEFLTVRAWSDGSYYIMTEDKQALTVIATQDDVQLILDNLPDTILSWEELEAKVQAEFLTNTDPGDEQDDSTE